MAELRSLKQPQHQLRAHVIAQLAQGEAALGSAIHAIVTEGGGDEGRVKRAAESLGNAQALFEELGERAHMQLMMRKQVGGVGVEGSGGKKGREGGWRG